MPAFASHRESALMCGAPKESPESTAKVIRVHLTLHLGEDLGSGYLSLGKRQARLDASMIVELPIYRVCQNFFSRMQPLLTHFVSLHCVAIHAFAIRQGLHLEQMYCVLCLGSFFKDARVVLPTASGHVW